MSGIAQWDDWMGIALELARTAASRGEVPVGAVVVRDGELLAGRHNERETANDSTAHAEVLALRDAATAVGGWRLTDCTLVVTLEPCAMCAGAALSSRIGAVVFGAVDLDAGALGSRYNLGVDPRLNHEFPVTPGVCAAESTALLEAFFGARRNQ